MLNNYFLKEKQNENSSNEFHVLACKMCKHPILRDDHIELPIFDDSWEVVGVVTKTDNLVNIFFNINKMTKK